MPVHPANDAQVEPNKALPIRRAQNSKGETPSQKVALFIQFLKMVKYKLVLVSFAPQNHVFGRFAADGANVA